MRPTTSSRYHIKRSNAALLAAVLSAALYSAGEAIAQPRSDNEDARVRASTLNAQSGKTRAEVRAELLTARRVGATAPNGESDTGRTEPPSFGSSMSRAQVHAEVIEARRLGLLDYRGDSAPTQITSEQAQQIRRAGSQAAGASTGSATR
jgi:Domain of unknown function (DUF4148)